MFEVEQAINPQKNNLFFEIGPGTGALTEKLMSQNIHIIAMDIDKKNIDLLGQKYDSSKHQFIHGNILKESLNFLSSKKHRIVGNLPYNISTQIILKLVKYFESLKLLISVTFSHFSQIENAVAFVISQFKFLHATNAFLLSIL